MLFNFVAVSSLLALGAQAAEHIVKVGAGGLVFEPAELTVAAGDDVKFEFQAKNHTVTQSTFADPCKAKPEGVNSGFMMTAPDVAAKPTWTINVKDVSTPLWFYCRQKTPADHCGAGMVFSLNPSAEQSHVAFVDKAKAAGAAANATAPAGGAPPAPAAAAAAPGGYGDSAPADNTAADNTAAEAANAPAQPNGATTVAAGSMASVLALVGVVASLM